MSYLVLAIPTKKMSQRRITAALNDAGAWNVDWSEGEYGLQLEARVDEKEDVKRLTAGLRALKMVYAVTGSGYPKWDFSAVLPDKRAHNAPSSTR